MNHMVNLLREHVLDSTRIHYVITRGGEAPKAQTLCRALGRVRRVGLKS